MSRHYAAHGGYAADPYAARSSYPTFLTPQETILLQLRAAGRGLLDAFRWDVVIRLVSSDAEVRANILKSLLLNCVSLASIYFFDLLLQPLTHGHTHWLRRNVGWAYQVLWLAPVVGVSLYLNSTWTAHLARRTYTLHHGARAAEAAPGTYLGVLNSIATSAYRGIMVGTSVTLSFVLRYVPYAGPALGFVFLCWVDAYYCFEFIWIARGYSLSRRMRHLEERWAYYFAFGLPPTALCMFGSTLANAAIFALIFPAYIIMATHARPQPVDAYNPTQSEPIRHPSPFVPIRIPVFTPVVVLNDALIRVLSVLGSFGAPRSSPDAFGGFAQAHRRAASDSVESVEEGEAGIELEAKPPPPPTGAPSTRIRVRRGSRGGSSRRKFD
ncbi:EI24-domain-containing protein [Phanerochaete sordida]|uniref:EI24-domain-containing protein n=1 Tax=Phanerochaete sordida TaxID=48140 RepID=A0A9P3GMK0_9APHY|nr:EI24-domain-containing protein [Phanerochaete sordida]